MKELSKMDATAQAELVKKKDISAVELVRSAIERIEALDPQLNAVIHKTYERALKEAAGNLPDGPFKGVPFLLKDIGIGTHKGDPFYAGTRFLKNADYRAKSTSYLVEKFKQAGLIILGRTNVPELGAWTTTEPQSFGACHNPWNPDHSTGGSSGGSAAAVAAGMVPMAHASDGGGSIRIPASQCGVVGLKPTRGRISLGPDMGESWAGLVFEFAETRTIRDCATLLDCVQGNMAGDPYACPLPSRPYQDEVGIAPGILKIGVLNSMETVDMKKPCIDAVESVARHLLDLGHNVVFDYPKALEDESKTGQIISVVAAAQARIIEIFEQEIGRKIGSSDMDCDNWAVTEMGKNVTATQYLAAVESIHQHIRNIAAWWESGYDLLVTPAIPEPPPLLGELIPDPDQPLKGFMRSGLLTPFMVPFNMTGQPAISLPLCMSEDGLPIGIQFVAGFGKEDVLFRIASQLEDTMPWRDRFPKIHA